MLERHECAHFHVDDVGQPGQRLATRDVFATTMDAARHDAGEWCADVGSPDLVINLPDADARDVGVTDGKITIRLGLLQLEFRYQARTLQLALATQLAFQLAHVDLRTLQQRLLLGALQQQGLLVDACNRVTRFNDGPGLGDHDQLTGYAGGHLDLVTAVNGAGHRHRRGDLGTFDAGDLHDAGRHLLLRQRGSREQPQYDCYVYPTHLQ